MTDLINLVFDQQSGGMGGGIGGDNWDFDFNIDYDPGTHMGGGHKGGGGTGGGGNYMFSCNFTYSF